jgi:hypothetical protein
VLLCGGGRLELLSGGGGPMPRASLRGGGRQTFCVGGRRRAIGRRRSVGYVAPEEGGRRWDVLRQWEEEAAAPPLRHQGVKGAGDDASNWRPRG